MQKQRKLCIDRGEEEEEEKKKTEQGEAGGGKGKMSPERDGGEKKEMGQSEIGGEEMKRKETLHPQTETDTVLEEERRGRGEGMEAGMKGEVETETGLERGIGPETERGMETVKGDSYKDRERGRDRERDGDRNRERERPSVASPSSEQNWSQRSSSLGSLKSRFLKPSEDVDSGEGGLRSRPFLKDV